MINWETIQVDGRPMRIYLGVPDHPGPHPAVLVAHSRHGADDLQMQDVVHRLYRQGYAAAVVEFYHRQPAGVDPLKRAGMLNDHEIIADLNATIAHLKTLSEPVGPIGICGFCMGGRVAYLAASTIKDIKAAAAFYGGNIMITRGDGKGPSPFERSKDIHCPVIAFTGADDENPSPADMKKISEELTRLGKVHEFHLYLDTDHAFHNFAAPRYRERAAVASWAEMLAFFTQHLRRGAAK